ncbi:hypothetical protein THIOSC15_1160013 [uncultured Thiomicrorhabdus sp.]
MKIKTLRRLANKMSKKLDTEHENSNFFKDWSKSKEEIIRLIRSPHSGFDDKQLVIANPVKQSSKIQKKKLF